MATDTRAQRVAAVSLGVTGVLVLLKFGVWVATGSLVVLSQALDSLLDVVALALLYIAIRIAIKPADREHHYGHGKAEHLAAFTQTLLIAVVVVGVVVEAALRLGEDPSVSAPWYAPALLAGSIVIDGTRAAIMGRTARAADSDALRAGALNIAGDVGTASLALVSLLLIRGGFEEADAIGALIIAAVVAVVAVRIGKRSVDVLMDRAPEARMDAIEAAAAAAPGVQEARRVRVRRSGNKLFADVTVAAGRTASLERAHDISDSVERAIQEIEPNADVVVHVEPISETGELGERVQASAGRVEGVHEVHNVLVHAFDEKGERKLHVTLHAKVLSGLSVREAHDLSDRVEAAIAEELGVGVRVDTHIEPLEQTAIAHDVTGDRADVVAAVKEAAQRETSVLDCHEVIVTETGAELAIMAHVRGRADLPLSEIHQASTRVENALHATYPEIASIVIHFEPG
jgi:cation diffusion facilitator family transporter